MILCLLLVALVAYTIKILNGWSDALHHIRCYHGDQADAREHAEVAYRALHPRERK